MTFEPTHLRCTHVEQQASREQMENRCLAPVVCPKNAPQKKVKGRWRLREAFMQEIVDLWSMCMLLHLLASSDVFCLVKTRKLFLTFLLVAQKHLVYHRNNILWLTQWFSWSFDYNAVKHLFRKLHLMNLENMLGLLMWSKRWNCSFKWHFRLNIISLVCLNQIRAAKVGLIVNF